MLPLRARVRLGFGREGVRLAGDILGEEARGELAKGGGGAEGEKDVGGVIW